MPIKRLIRHLKKNDWRVHSRNLTINVSKFTKSFKDDFVTLIISALGLVVALSWNNFWVAWINSLPLENTVPYKFLIALGITVLAVIFTYFLSRLKSPTWYLKI